MIYLAGAAGAVVANRLSENHKFSVLLLEAGGSNENILDSEIPAFAGLMAPGTIWDWNFTSTPQTGMNNRSVAAARGFMLGGSTSINFMVYTRGSAEDYDRYAAITGDKGWSWDRLQPYIRKNERFLSPPRHPNVNPAPLFNPRVHSFNGVNTVSLEGFPKDINGKIIKTVQDLHSDFPFNLDMNSGNHLGIGWVQATVKNGVRSSSATSYLGPQFINRSNLHVLLNARVTRVHAKSGKGRKLTFDSVEFMQNGAKSQIISASKEIILSAGTMMSPHILLHSGIGDSKMLRRLGISPVLHLPSVGQNFSDQPALRNQWIVNSTDTQETFVQNATFTAQQTDIWQKTKTGPLVDPPNSFLGWLRLPKNSDIFKRFRDPTPGPHTAHFEFVIANGLLARSVTPTSPNFLRFGTAVVQPLSRGTITINSTNPLDPPIIDYRLLTSNYDVSVLREAFRQSNQFLKHPVWKDYLVTPPTNATTDEEIEAYIKANAGPMNHPIGSCAMSSRNANHGVLDPDLRVKGVQGLRVVDASIFPVTPTAHTQAPVYIIAERAADLIKAAWH
ncbi:aryl-alcohol-oxidase from pleurotus Eryingii [Marasmius fiardii PR-910]|nr:aryl-alcohol-oxidase from pleurotus Eryingii [Marasmius fiardii PR-910]